ncbi:MAG: hypothetical protein E3J72_02915 [Planctomycetota bacterium]|nr:MAG: hypothetical protein E3J72_02915 [Planctomycetota bacterium]
MRAIVSTKHSYNTVMDCCCQGEIWRSAGVLGCRG